MLLKRKLLGVLMLTSISLLFSNEVMAEQSDFGSGENLSQFISKNDEKEYISDFDLNVTLRDTENRLIQAATLKLDKYFESTLNKDYIKFLTEVANTDNIVIGDSEKENVEFNEFAAIYVNRIGSILPSNPTPEELDQLKNSRDELIARTYLDIRSENRNAILLSESVRSPNKVPAYFNISAATYYAKQYAKKYNPNFRAFDNDCTNFTSQIAQAGGKQQSYIPNASGLTWYYFNGLSYSITWTVAHQFFVYWTAEGASMYQYNDKASAQAGMSEGSFVAYFKKNTFEITHASYVSQKSGGKAYITQHTTDRLNEAWDNINVSAYSSFIIMKF